MANVKNNSASRATRRRLIDAAGEIFADVGYERATIKQITDRAGASLAAVNYHFSDKAELYYEVLLEAQQASIETMKAFERLPEDATPQSRLTAFIEMFLRNHLDPDRPRWHGSLLARELMEPTDQLARIKSEHFTSHVDKLEALMRQLVQVPMSRCQLMLYVESVIGQCLFYVTHQRMQRLCHPDSRPAAERIDDLAKHIACFSLDAIAGVNRGACPDAPNN